MTSYYLIYAIMTMLEGILFEDCGMEPPNFKLKNDKYRKARGGEAHLLDIYCVQCNGHLMKYQKDGKGQLMRCYLNRIFHPPALERLQYTIAYLKQMSNLVCLSCSTVIGTPMVYDDGRLAFRLRKGFYSKKRAD